VNIKIAFSPAPVLLGTGVFATCTAWLALCPDTGGPIGRVLSGNGRIVTIVAVAVGLTMTLLFGFLAIRMAFGMPALVARKNGIQVYLFPIQRLRWSQIDDVRIESSKLLIVKRGGRGRKINLSLLAECDAAVAEIREVLANQRR
jgi:hypothetical protein